MPSTIPPEAVQIMAQWIAYGIMVVFVFWGITFGGRA